MAIFISGGVGGSTTVTTTGQNAKEGKETTTTYSGSGSSPSAGSSNSNVAKSSGGSSGSSGSNSSNLTNKDYINAGGSATGYKTYASWKNAQNDIRSAQYKEQYGYNPRTTQERAEANKMFESSKNANSTPSGLTPEQLAREQARIQQEIATTGSYRPISEGASGEYYAPRGEAPKPARTLPEGASIINQGQAGERIFYKGAQYDPEVFYEEQERIGTDRMGVYSTEKTPEFMTRARIRDFIERGYGEYSENEYGFQLKLTPEGKVAKSTFVNALNMDFPDYWDLQGSTDTLYFTGKGTTTYREAPPLLNEKWRVGNEAVYSSGYPTSVMGLPDIFSSAPTETATAYQPKPLLNDKWKAEDFTEQTSGKGLYIPEGGNLFSSGVLMEEPKTFTEQYREREAKINQDVAEMFNFREGIESQGAKTLEGMLGLRGYADFYTGSNQFTKQLYKDLGDASAGIITDFGKTAVRTFFDIPQAGTGLVLTKGGLLGEYVLEPFTKPETLTSKYNKNVSAQEIIKQDIGGLYTAGLFGASSFVMSFRENPMKASLEAGRYGLTEVVPSFAVANLYLLSARQLGDTAFPTPKTEAGISYRFETPKKPERLEIKFENQLTKEQLADSLKNKLAKEGVLKEDFLGSVPKKIPTKPGVSITKDYFVPSRAEIGQLLKEKLAGEGVLRSEKMLAVPSRTAPDLMFNVPERYIKPSPLSTKYVGTTQGSVPKKWFSINDVIKETPKPPGTGSVGVGKGMFQLTKTKTIATQKPIMVMKPTVLTKTLQKTTIKTSPTAMLLSISKPKTVMVQEQKQKERTLLSFRPRMVMVQEQKQAKKEQARFRLNPLSLFKTTTKTDTKQTPLEAFKPKEATAIKPIEAQTLAGVQITGQPQMLREEIIQEQPQKTGEEQIEETPPPPKFQFTGTDPFDRKKKKKTNRFAMPDIKKGKRSVYADLFSIHASQVKYGKGTSPSMIKRPETWKYERGGFGRIPTTEQLDKPKPKKNTFNNLISGFKKRGKKWF